MGMITDRPCRYIDVAETARIIRRRLKKEFPATKFGVRSKRYNGGTSITIDWTDGPLGEDVRAVTDDYQGSGFDGMIDMKYPVEHFMKPDGSVKVRHTPGTTGSRGLVAEIDNRQLDGTMPEGTERVRFGADHLTRTRRISDRRARQAEATEWIYDHCVIEQRGPERAPHQDRFGGEWVSHVIDRMIHSRREDEDMAAAFARAMNLPARPPEDAARQAA